MQTYIHAVQLSSEAALQFAAGLFPDIQEPVEGPGVSYPAPTRTGLQDVDPVLDAVLGAGAVNPALLAMATLPCGRSSPDDPKPGCPFGVPVGTPTLGFRVSNCKTYFAPAEAAGEAPLLLTSSSPRLFGVYRGATSASDGQAYHVILPGTERPRGAWTSMFGPARSPAFPTVAGPRTRRSSALRSATPSGCFLPSKGQAGETHDGHPALRRVVRGVRPRGLRRRLEAGGYADGGIVAHDPTAEACPVDAAICDFADVTAQHMGDANYYPVGGDKEIELRARAFQELGTSVPAALASIGCPFGDSPSCQHSFSLVFTTVSPG